jgi:hypothetical protein
MLKPDYQIRPIDFRIENVGKLIQGSKRRYAWRFQSPFGPHQLTLTLSVMSSKFKLSLDNNEIERGDMPYFAPFEHRVARGDLRFLVEQHKTNMKLYINEQLFEPNCLIDVWVNRNGRPEKSKSVAKLIPKESQLDRPLDRRQTEYGLGTGGPPANSHYVNRPPLNYPPAPLHNRQEELEKIRFNKGLLVSEGKSPTTVHGPSASRLQWRNLDPYEEQPDKFFGMTFNHDTKTVSSIITKLYCP